ncbi:hypothetical protein GCM10017083_22750 [Thalassobaculum fulvum]|uniref:Uncharacterized protein n=1 Tax=Thalassobaculum fulvum TaxID=1633335 RepID=A0A918XRI5_9PROT|nr:hypothetical protein [Thalassobaculum fulvum]GHD49874.1 hypothetical protein GCM10017083_22750 [Thalassobaculum fulvum]
MSDSATTELNAIKIIHDALAPLDVEARTRVLTYVTSLLGLDIMASSSRMSGRPADRVSPETTESSSEATTKDPTFSTFAELYAAADPQSNGEKALVAGYWLQVCQGTESFTGASANKELTNLGHKVANITDAIDSVKNQKPMLILQIRKSGNSRQARKLYKVSHEGIKRVEELINE